MKFLKHYGNITYVMSGQQIIKDLTALSDEFVPEHLLHRQEHREEILQILQPLRSGSKSQPLLLYGPPGTGKTSLANDIAKELREETYGLKTCYVNCWIDHSEFRALYSIVQQVNSPLLIHRKGTPTDELVDRWERTVRKDRVLVIMDEVDQLKEKETLYVLVKPKVGLIFIADTEAALYDVSMRTRSRLGTLKLIKFKAYSSKDLLSILRARASIALRPGTITQKQLRTIASSSQGDARRAIEALRIAAENARQEERNAISDSNIRQAIPAARKISVERGFSKLNLHQRVLYSIIQDSKEIRSADLYRRYYEAVQEPVQVRTLRNYLRKLEFHRFIQARGTGRWRIYSLKE